MRFLTRLFEPGDLVLIRQFGRTYYTTYVEMPNPLPKLSDTNTFFGVCPRVAPGKDKAVDITTVRCLWVDIDGTTDWKQRCKNVPDPTLVVYTGGGVQCYWKLSEPIAPSAAVPRLKWLAKQVGGDHVYDVARVLRLPSTRNHKYRPPKECLWVRDTGTTFGASRFPEYRDAPLNVQRGSQVRGEVSERLLGYAADLATTPVGQRSSREFGFICYAVATNHSPDKVYALVENVGKFAEKGRSYFDRTWESALRKLGMTNCV